MTKRRRIILWSATILAVLGLTVWLICPSGPPDPIYGGHRLSFYVAVVPPSQNWMNTELLDSNAIPYLVHTLKQHDGPVRRAYIRVYPRFPVWLSSRLGYPLTAARLKFTACGFLGSLGSTARPAIPDLIQLAGSNEESWTRLAAIQALARIASRNDTNVMACLTTASKDGDISVRTAAVIALQQLDPRIGPNDVTMP
jgi:HEAT repeat protein